MVEVIKVQDSAPLCSFPLKNITENSLFYTSPLHKPPFEYALDIASPEGEEIFCPVNGKVIDLRQYSTQWVPYSKDKDPNQTLNWITIQVLEKKGLVKRKYKETQWIVQLCHIQAFSSQYKIGDFVKKGEFLARVGINGMISTTRGVPDSHLHVVIGKGLSSDNPFLGFQSYPLVFE